MNYVSRQSWHMFRVRFPAAAAWLDEASLFGEFQSLQSLAHPNDWERTRLEHLKTWLEDASFVAELRKQHTAYKAALNAEATP